MCRLRAGSDPEGGRGGGGAPGGRGGGAPAAPGAVREDDAAVRGVT